MYCNTSHSRKNYTPMFGHGFMILPYSSIPKNADTCSRSFYGPHALPSEAYHHKQCRNSRCDGDVTIYLDY